MKMNIKYIFALLVLGAFVSSCVNEDESNQERETSVGEASVEIEVLADDGSPVSGATVSVFTNADDYVSESNAVASLTTDGSGMISISPSDIGLTDADLGEATCCGSLYFSVAAGNLRNWSSNISTPYLYWASGPTKISTTVSSVLPEFLAIIANDWDHSSYGGADTSPACNNDDYFSFLKTGEVIRYDAGTVCDPTREAVAEGTVWSTWSLNDDGTEITIRDYDPYWYNTDQVFEGDATLTVSEGSTLTIDFGAPYIWNLTAR